MSGTQSADAWRWLLSLGGAWGVGSAAALIAPGGFILVRVAAEW
jgi:hypothetical protein